MSDEKLEKEFEIYKELAKSDKKVDVATLMINALNQHQANLLSPKLKRWSYIISLAAPPFGLIFAVKFFFSDKDDAKQAAWMCVLLTGITILLLIIFANVLFSGSGLSVDQIKSAPADYRSLLQ